MLPIFFQETSTELSEMETSLRNKAEMVEKLQVTKRPRNLNQD